MGFKTSLLRLLICAFKGLMLVVLVSFAYKCGYSQGDPVPTDGETTVVYLGHTSAYDNFADLTKRITTKCFITDKSVDETCSAPFLYRTGSAMPLLPGSKYQSTVRSDKDGHYYLQLQYSPIHPVLEIYSTSPDLCMFDTGGAGPVHWEPGTLALGCVAGEMNEAQSTPAKPWDELSAREQFGFYIGARYGDQHFYSDDERRQYDDTDLHGIIATSLKLTPPPAIPERAREAFVEGATYLKNGDAVNAELQFHDAVEYAPWWADAHYNDAIALEKLHYYDDAVKEFRTYLLFDPLEAEAREAQDRIYAITAEKQLGAEKYEEYKEQLRVKYVSGGARRVCDTTLLEFGITTGLYGGYVYRSEGVCYSNLFAMGNGDYIAASLIPLASPDGIYMGDKIELSWITHLDQSTPPDAVQDYDFNSLDESFSLRSGHMYKVSISTRRNDGVVQVADPTSGAAFTLPISDLYGARWRTAWRDVSVGSKEFRVGYALSTDHQHWNATFFDVSLIRSIDPRFSVDQGFLDPLPADGLGLVPTYVVPLLGHDTPIADTGYFIRYQGDTWKVEK